MDAPIHPPPSVVPQDAQDAAGASSWICSHANASWAESLFKGNVETRKQFDELVAKAAAAMMLVMRVAGIVEPVTPLMETTANGSFRAGTSRGRSRA